MLTVTEAYARLIGLAKVVASERVGLHEAQGRVLAEDVVSQMDLPAFDYSAMDGYAVRCGDFAGAGPWRLAVRGESKTGGSPPPFAPGSACRIFTGAELPPGTDAVVMQEDVEVASGVDDGYAVFRAHPDHGHHVRRRGEDLARGRLALPRGTRLSPSQVGLLASLDRPWAVVARRPIVTVLGTGDELRAPGTPGNVGSIPESNGTALRAMALGAGAVVRLAPFARDDAEGTRAAISEALDATDVLVTVGGVSVGAHDLVRPALEAVGVALDFWKVAVKPGKPLAVGRRASTIVLGLPGNPGSAMITFALFGLPLLRALQGDLAPIPRRHPARIGRAVAHAPGRTEILRCEASYRHGALVAMPLANQASGAVTSMAYANALAVVPQDRGALAEGDPVELLWLHELGA